ncbi:MAG: DMT family transporter [Clostridia bacterium]|nr:DMT family transporter [Clostridia bacterium]
MKSFQNLKGSLILCLASMIWGLAFVAQSAAADNVPPLLCNALRSLIGALFLFGLLAVTCRKSGRPIFPKTPELRKKTLVGGALCGLFLTVSVNLQQFGITYYPAGVASEARAGFLTALYVILVPLISVILGKRLSPALIAAVIIAMVGIWFLCFSGGIDGFYLGDLLIFLCSISFSLHILTIDHYVDAVGGIALSFWQFSVCALLSGILSLCFETPSWQSVLDAAPQILYLGLFSSGIAYTLQIVGQKFAEPTVASLTMSLESVFAALGGWIIAGNALSSHELLGCLLVFCGIILAQIPFPTKKKTTPENLELSQDLGRD